MHVGVFADIEGSFGIWRMRQCKMGTAEWQYGRECLTADVNHVIQGAFDGGADKVTVKDTHEVGFNCLIRKLDSRAGYVGGHFIQPSFFGNIKAYDLILYVAIHAASGTPDAFFPHTHYGIFSEVKINGKSVCEMEVYGGYLGDFGIPVGFVSGEEIAVEQAKTALPWIKTVVVDKNKETYTSGEKSRQYLIQGREKLRQAASQSVQEASTMKPFILKKPLFFEAKFRTPELANRFNTWNFQQSGDIVQWSADNMIDGFDKLNKLTFFPKKIYPFRRPMLLFLRNYFRIKNTYFTPIPDSEGAPLIS
jgi:D-amino peptidase